jgi:hypothetical protein
MFDSSFSEGRRIAIERRRAIAQGRSALPPVRERTRSSAANSAGAQVAAAEAQPAHRVEPVSAALTVAPPLVARVGALTGRLVSMWRRKQSSAGKGALAPAPTAAAQSTQTAAPLNDAPPAERAATASSPVTSYAEQTTARGQQFARRARLERAAARAAAGPAASRPQRPPRAGRLEYAPKVVVDQTTGGQKVTGLRYTDAARITGAAAGLSKPVSGTQYISPRDGALRPQAPKCGVMLTEGGQLVSGTLIRAKVPITGDEAGERIRVTGNVDGSTAQDITPRESSGYGAMAQFARQANPHGHSVFGTNLGRSLRVAGSRSRERERPIETTDGGRPITGSAIGRSARVTGDEAGACRTITGDQYLAPAGAQAECGGSGGGTASPSSTLPHVRRDPVTGAKVTVASTWGAARITGTDVEHRPLVTGDEPGSCSVITGTPYQGPDTMYGWCSEDAAAQAEATLPERAAAAEVTGDVPLHSDDVTGTERGSAREVTGTPYYRGRAAQAESRDARTRINDGFSVMPPQRRAQLERQQVAQSNGGATATITGSFAHGEGKITGSVEFVYRPRRTAADETPPPRVSGEGSRRRGEVTGDAWAAHGRVTGTEGPTAYERNPSQRGGKPHAFAGARLFKGKAQHDEPRQLITGMVGWSPKSAAKVTLSGGAQG